MPNHGAPSSKEPEPRDPESPSEASKSLLAMGRFGAIGFEMAVFLILGIKGGQWLDERYDTEYWVLVGLVLGIAAGFRSLFQLARRPTPRSTPEEEQEPQKAPSEPSKTSTRGGLPPDPNDP